MSILDAAHKEATDEQKMLAYQRFARQKEAERLQREIGTYLRTNADTAPDFLSRATEMLIILQQAIDQADLFNTRFTLSGKCPPSESIQVSGEVIPLKKLTE